MSWAQQLVVNTKMSAARALFKVFGADRESQTLAQVASQLDPLRREVERLSRFSVRNRLYAYCFCGAD